MNKKAEKIIGATIRLFIRDGVKRITMDDIAECAKASKVTIYKYFTDKDTLYLEAGRHIFSDYRKRLNAIAASGETLMERMYAFMDVIADFTDSGKFALCKNLSAYNDAVESEYALYLETYRHTIDTLIDEGMKTGVTKRGLDREMIFYIIDMGVAYYQQNSGYRERMRGDGAFQKRFMLHFIGNVFTDGAQVLSGG